MAVSSVLSVIIYEHVGMTAPFYIVAVFSGVWAAVVVMYFLVRLHGRYSEDFTAAEQALLRQLQRERVYGSMNT